VSGHASDQFGAPRNSGIITARCAERQVPLYNALNQRIGIDDSGGGQTRTVYNGTSADALPYADFNGSGTLLTRYVSGPGIVNGTVVDELLARTSSGGTTAWYLTDKLDSVRDIVSSAGSELDHIVYDSFGNITTETSASNGDRFKFAGMEFDSTAGQYYDRARWYDESLGRFTSLDPAGFRSASTNPEAYVSNDSPNETDHSGKLPDSPDVANSSPTAVPVLGLSDGLSIAGTSPGAPAGSVSPLTGPSLIQDPAPKQLPDLPPDLFAPPWEDWVNGPPQHRWDQDLDTDPGMVIRYNIPPWLDPDLQVDENTLIYLSLEWIKGVLVAKATDLDVEIDRLSAQIEEPFGEDIKEALRNERIAKMKDAQDLQDTIDRLKKLQQQYKNTPEPQPPPAVA
jgi:RHS repeat-associated protein